MADVTLDIEGMDDGTLAVLAAELVNEAQRRMRVAKPKGVAGRNKKALAGLVAALRKAYAPTGKLTVRGKPWPVIHDANTGRFVTDEDEVRKLASFMFDNCEKMERQLWNLDIADLRGDQVLTYPYPYVLSVFHTTRTDPTKVALVAPDGWKDDLAAALTQAFESLPARGSDEISFERDGYGRITGATMEPVA